MCTVLVISDDYLTKEKVGELLGGLQLPAVVATTEFEVTRACISKRPGIVIADIETTGGVGFESIATARRLAREAYIIESVWRGRVRSRSSLAGSIDVGDRDVQWIRSRLMRQIDRALRSQGSSYSRSTSGQASASLSHRV
jgi:FixJ family two-component response regulator